MAETRSGRLEDALTAEGILRAQPGQSFALTLLCFPAGLLSLLTSFSLTHWKYSLWLSVLLSRAFLCSQSTPAAATHSGCAVWQAWGSELLPASCPWCLPSPGPQTSPCQPCAGSLAQLHSVPTHSFLSKPNSAPTAASGCVTSPQVPTQKPLCLWGSRMSSALHGLQHS